MSLLEKKKKKEEERKLSQVLAFSPQLFDMFWLYAEVSVRS